MTPTITFDGHAIESEHLDHPMGGAAVIVLVEREEGLRLHKVRLRDRLASRLLASSLDSELAAGTSPESSVRLALHAEHLHQPSQRRVLALSLRRVGAASQRATSPRGRVPMDRDAVRRARPEIEAVASRLTSPGPVDVRGVARLRTLLADGSGPLYREKVPGRLRRELVASLASLDPPGAD